MKNKIQLHSKWYDLEKSRQKLKSNLPQWEADIFLFLVDWFSDSDTISVQTSGSTGAPKLMTKRKSAMRHSAQLTGQFFNFGPNKTALLCLPAKYIAGKMMLVRAIEWQLDLTYVEPKIELQIPQKSIFFSAMTPQQVEANILHLRAMQNLIIGGAPISSNLEKMLGSVPTNMFATYGMTETVSHIALRKITAPITDTYTLLNGVCISTDDRNCLQIDAPQLHPEILITNDIVEITSSNTFIWKGRYDHIINSGGVKTSPERIERQIAPFISSPFIVSGVPDDKWGEKIVLIIEGPEFDLSSLRTKIETVLTGIEIPKEIYFIPEFVRTENQKIKRKPTTQLVQF